MQLKRIEIHGFKSFADRCVIDFPPGISAVVGPNGCGKSNIMDAIKWVMGEQSIKQLRGKSMGDVIFAGTDKRAPVNMAEVSLILARNDTALPEPVGQFTEIMITRRLYRSGESAYLLNKQPCRLKDINDIFLRYGMGPRSCAIIQQGNIGAITDATPEERRAFIEEAAGVIRYKTRKQEAMTKVNATRQNLLRLGDILEEIEKQLNSLSRQAKKAERFKQYRQQLKEAEILVTVHYYEDYTRRIENTENLLKELSEKDSDKAAALEKLNAALQEMEDRRRKKEQQIAEKRTDRSERQRRIDKIEYDLKLLSNESSRIDEEIARIEAALADLHEKNGKLETEIVGGTEKTASLKSRLERVRAELDAEKHVVDDYNSELREQNLSLENKKKRLMELAAQRARYQNIYQNAAANKENLKKRIRQIEGDRTETEEKVAELIDKESEILQQQERLNQQLDSLNRQKSECESALKDRSTDLGARIKTVNALGNDRSKVKSKLGVLKKMASNFEWYRDGVKAVMKHGTAPGHESDGRDPRIIGITAEVIDPEPGYEPAVEAVMGEALQYILVRGQDSGVEFMNYLREEKAGRSGFIPVDTDEASQPAGPHPASIASPLLLAGHVSIRPGFEALIGSLLAGVAVVDDFDAALALHREGNGFDRIVTKDGDIIYNQGIMVGGSKDRLSGILEKKQEMRSLEAELETLENQIAEEKTRQEALEAEVRDLEKSLATLTEKKYRYESEQRDAEKALFQTAEALKHARRHLEIVTLEHKRLQGEKEDINNEIAQHDTALGEIAKDIEAVESGIEALNGRIRILTETIRTYDNKQLDLKLELTKLGAELENNQRTVSRLEQFRKEGMRQAEQLRHDIAVKKQRAANSGEQIVQLEARLAGESETLKFIKSSLKADESDYQDLVEKLAGTDASISESKTALERTREKIHKLELELSGLQINRENIVNRFLERYSDSFAAIRSAWRERVIVSDFSIEKTENDRLELRTKIDQVGDVNLGAIEAYEEQKTRYDFLVKQREDLEEALTDLENVIRKINRITQKLFTETFDAINENFQGLFPKLFNGGAAWLELTQPDSPLETGVELMIQPPGKKLSRLSLLSGGEKALSAIAFIFSIFLLNPASFCLLDEIDAPLDEVNVYRFNELLRIIGAKTQIIMISHNKKTMEFADMLFGITMAQSGGSRMISVNMDQALKMNDNDPKTPGSENSEGNGHARLPQ